MPKVQLLFFVVMCILLSTACKKRRLICGPNTHLVSDTCLCNTGWIGADCSVPAYKLAGTYHMVGSSHISNVWGDSTKHVDKMMDVIVSGDTLYIYPSAYSYYETVPATDNSYLFYWNGNHVNYVRLAFIKNTDSLYYYSSSGGNMGIVTTSLSGIKIQ